MSPRVTNRNTTDRSPLDSARISAFSGRHAVCGRLVVEVTEYRRRRPEESVLYQVVQENLATFLERAAHRGGGKGLPTYVCQWSGIG